MNKPKLIFDLCSIPVKHNFDIDKWLYYVQEQGIVFYDSTEGNAPEVVDHPLTVIDLANLTSTEIQELFRQHGLD